MNYPQLVVSTAKYNRQLVLGTVNYLVRKRRYLPKKQFLYGKGGTNNKFNFTTVPLVPQLVPHYRFFRRPKKQTLCKDVFGGGASLRFELKNEACRLVVFLVIFLQIVDGGR